MIQDLPQEVRELRTEIVPKPLLVDASTQTDAPKAELTKIQDGKRTHETGMQVMVCPPPNKEIIKRNNSSLGVKDNKAGIKPSILQKKVLKGIPKNVHIE